VSAVESVPLATHIGRTNSGGVLTVSFAGVRALSPSFASALLLALDRLKVERAVTRVRLVNLSRAHARTVQRSIDSLRLDARTWEG